MSPPLAYKRHDESHPVQCHAALPLADEDTDPSRPCHLNREKHCMNDAMERGTSIISLRDARYDKFLVSMRHFARRPHLCLFSIILLSLISTFNSAVAWSTPAIHSLTPFSNTASSITYVPVFHENERRSFRLHAASKHPSKSALNRHRPASSLDAPLLRELNQQLESLLSFLETTMDPTTEHAVRDTTDHNHNALSSNEQPLAILQEMLTHLKNYTLATPHPTLRPMASSILDKAFRAVSTQSFSPPYTVHKINLGMKTLELQLQSSSLLIKPYDSIPRGVWLRALRALTCSSSSGGGGGEVCYDRTVRCITTISGRGESKDGREWITPADAAFRILQRLVTMRGVRAVTTKHSPTRRQQQQRQMTMLDERDFNMVLHAYASLSTNQMHSAHRVLALQERTGHAPPLSPVAYSILLKAYGRWRDVENVETTLWHARRNGVLPDIVMANTVLDAYVNCGLVGKAEELFDALAGKDGASSSVAVRDYWPLLPPNIRTYNTMLKGMATEGRLDDALILSDTMLAKGIWDDITTNTLVKVAVTAQEFEVAESLLANHTSTNLPPSRSDHPNVEAYTELIDGYAKDGQLEKALEIMQLMQKRGVTPNEYTYTCIVGALARNNKVRQAKKMMEYVTSLHFPSSNRGRRVLTPTFNAFLSGLLSMDGTMDQGNAGGQSHSLNILEALNTLSEMEKMNIYPNVVTVTLLIDGLANCNPPRCKEAKDLVQHLEFTMRVKQKGEYSTAASEGYSNQISLSNAKIATALIRAYGRANDIDAATESFRRIAHPDVVALNALLDACCRCSQLKRAFDMFEKYASFEKWRDEEFVVDIGADGEETRLRPIKPDVVTYTTLIAAILQLKNKNASKRASRLYNEMKQRWRISPDTVLIDNIASSPRILMAMTSGGPRGFETDDIQFTLTALRDGDRLHWEGEQYEKRKKAVRSVLMACSSEVWKKDKTGYGLMNSVEPPETDDPLFLKKGWNKIDSGFRLWGGGNADGGESINSEGDKEKSVDSFLASKGWNDIDSGFRIL
eukprot:CCRYP_014336-RA/>CCRYP_014336-RA protein AED:0.00 eAED:-0.00 QI:94/0/0.5/1/1/1/2/0/1025